MPIGNVAAPAGFKITPAKAVSPIMARGTRAPWADAYLFADGNRYYFGNGEKGQDIAGPQPGHWVIDGATGRIVSQPD